MTSPPATRRARLTAARRMPWGWLEWFVVSHTFIPALLFIPNAQAIRVLVRIGSFALPLVAWAAVAASGRSRAGASSFPANIWLRLVAGWLLLQTLNPSTNSIQAGLAHVTFYVAVFSPAFWAPSVLKSPGQVGRLMAISLACAGLSALVGLGQVFRPATFNPPVIPGVQLAPGVLDDTLAAQALSYEDANGQRIIRPCGLTDSPGSAGIAAPTAVVVGLAFALRPIGAIRRLFCVFLALSGAAVIYYTQVRMTMMLTVICLAVLVAIFMAQRDFARATLLGGLGAGIVVLALVGVASRSGWGVVQRFVGLYDNFEKSYATSGRASFVQHAFEYLAFEYPAGAGLGRWGTIYQSFGVKDGKTIWVEVMVPALIVDGGIPLIILYGGAIVAALADVFRVALTSRDAALRYWAAVVFATNLGVVATCFSYPTFLSALGLPFWFLASVIHAADLRVRAAAAAAAPRPRPVPPAPPRPGPIPAPS